MISPDSPDCDSVLVVVDDCIREIGVVAGTSREVAASNKGVVIARDAVRSAYHDNQPTAL